jgi:hypothetical protein
MSSPPVRDERSQTHWQRGAAGYGLVLVLVTGSITLQLLATGSTGVHLAAVGLQAATLATVVWTAGARRRLVRLAAGFAVVAVGASFVVWVLHGSFPSSAAAIVNLLLVAVAPPVLAAGLVRALREEGEVTLRTVAGVLAIYLLAGMLFAAVYGVIGAVDETAVFAGQTDSTAAERLFFSFVTLTTTGYGDLTPGAEITRAFAVGEMLFGQIYLVTVVAVIVSNLGRGRQAPGRA